MFKCCDCSTTIPENESDKTMPNADRSATIQCLPCHEIALGTHYVYGTRDLHLVAALLDYLNQISRAKFSTQPNGSTGRTEILCDETAIGLSISARSFAAGWIAKSRQ